MPGANAGREEENKHLALVRSSLPDLDIPMLAVDLERGTAAANRAAGVTLAMLAFDLQVAEVGGTDVTILGSQVCLERRLFGNHQVDITILIRNVDRSDFAAVDLDVAIRVFHPQFAV